MPVLTFPAKVADTFEKIRPPTGIVYGAKLTSHAKKITKTSYF
jgi:hypothetical protein